MDHKASPRSEIEYSFRVVFYGSVEKLKEVTRNYYLFREIQGDPFLWIPDSMLFDTKSFNRLILWDRVNQRKTLAYIIFQETQEKSTLLYVYLSKPKSRISLVYKPKLKKPKLLKSNVSNPKMFIPRWRVYQHYWKALHKELGDQGWLDSKNVVTEVKKLRRGGPIPKSDSKKWEIIKGWLEVKGDMTQESYCMSKAISSSTLRKWMRQMSQSELERMRQEIDNEMK
jgi:hypothetical protein